MDEIIKVGHNRLAILIGPNGQTRRDICAKTKTNVEVDSHTGDVIISSDKTFYEIHIAKKVITAIARGFSPENAFKLLIDGQTLEVIPLDEHVNSTSKRHTQIKGRIIGKEGKVKTLIERKLNCVLAIYGKTVSIIGPEDNIKDIRKVVEKILGGSRHTVVFKMLKVSGLKADGYKPVKKTDEIDDINFD